jgi:hypothetical protein
VDLERYKKDAKALARAHRAADADAIARAEAVLGDRARQRFQLSDAQHVVAVEHGYRTWPELKRAAEVAEPERPVARIGLQPISFYEGRAAELAAGVASGEPEALRRASAYVPRGPEDARLVIAREYGFETWRELVATVERVLTINEGQREGTPEVLAALAAIRSADADGLRDLLDADPSLTGHVHNGAWGTLLEAIAQPDVVGNHLVVDLGVDPQVVTLLIERGSPLDGALNLAACFNRAELVGILLDGGADPAPDPAKGLTPLETALYHGARESAERIAARAISPLSLWSAAALGRIDLMEQLSGKPQSHRPNLADVGWQPDAPPGGDEQTILDEALGHAAHNGRDDAVEWLLAHGADVNGAPYQGLTPLHFAVQFGHASTVKLLLERGADPALRERIQNSTPLEAARSSGMKAIAGLIAGVDTGREYAPGDPVRLRVDFRRYPYVLDDGAAVEKAGRPEGWRTVADRVARDLGVNVSRGGVVSLPVVARGPGFDVVAERIGLASLTLYEELLELKG